MEWLSGFLDQIIAFFQYVWDFLTTGIYDLIKDGLVMLTKAAIYSWVKVQIFALGIAYEAAQDITTDIGVTDFVRQRYSGIPSEIASVLEFFGVPQALNIIFSALSTRFALRFVPFMGR